MKVVIDAMGSDAAPANEVAGCVKALKESRTLEIVLVGDVARLEKELSKYSFPADRLEIVAATEVIGMDERPAEALRRKKDSSIRVAALCVREGRGQALVSAGNTGAVAAAALTIIGRVRGVRRPAIAALFPSRSGYCTVADVGANVNCKGIHLFQFGVMGEVYARTVIGIPKPRVGLLSVGEEEAKGSEAVFEANRLLARAPLDYRGHVEGGDILQGRVDVVACDGFTGNALLKFAEAVPGIVFSGLRNEVKRDLLVRVGAWMARAGLRRLKRRWDYAEYGGAPLLGVKGAVIICHGKSSPKAIKNAALVAERFTAAGAIEQIMNAIGSAQDGL